MRKDATEHLLSSPNNAARLRRGIADLDAGKGIEIALHQIYDETLKEGIKDDEEELLRKLA
jgi:hypothetical protein